MPVDYQALVSVAEELNKEQQQISQSELENENIQKQRWLISFETQGLLRETEKNFEETFNALINNYDKQPEFWVRGKLAELKVLKQFINRIVNKGDK